MGAAAAGLTLAGAMGRPAFAGGTTQAATRNDAPTRRRVALHNLHTGERLEVEYFRGDYLPDALASIRVLLRDFRNDEQHAIDPALMDYLVEVAHHAGVDPAFDVISGYRSAQTNEKLRERSAGVARHSLHLEGRAIDVRLAGVDCRELAGAALTLARGGVGYYRRSDFVHLDTGLYRTWKG
jgi:uncharacterized protein YcbK (DUF882 family)